MIPFIYYSNQSNNGSIAFCPFNWKSCQSYPHAYNLFQIRTRLGNYGEAMDILNSAIRADAAQFGPHDTKKYPPLRMMGAGSLGCSFQCENTAGGKTGFWLRGCNFSVWR